MTRSLCPTCRQVVCRCTAIAPDVEPTRVGPLGDGSEELPSIQKEFRPNLLRLLVAFGLIWLAITACIAFWALLAV